MKGIILNGGYGTRLKPITFSLPKSLIPIANKPMSEYALDVLKQAGISEVMCVNGNNSKKIEEYYKDGKQFGIKISHIVQDEPKGISHAINLCKKFVKNEKFVVFLGDNILLKDISNYVSEFEQSNDVVKIILYKVDKPKQFGIAELKKDGTIKKIIEKPKKTSSDLAVIGVYFLTPKIFEIIEKLKPSRRGELEITDALQMLVKSKQKISYEIIKEYWKDAGTFQDIFATNKNILLKITKKASNGIIVGKNTIIEKNAKITGPVIIGNNCVIGKNVRIYPFTSIGNNVRLKNCSIKNSIIMNDCEIEYNATFFNSILSPNSKFNSKKKKLISCILGENSIIS